MSVWDERKEVRLHVIVVEDNPAHARLATKNFKRVIPRDWDVTVCEDGASVFVLLETLSLEDDPVCVMLDLNLPDMTGVDVLRRLRSNAKTGHIPVCMLTSSNNPSEVAECYRLGCSYFFSKNEGGDFFHEGLADLVRVFKTMCWPLWQPDTKEGE